MSLTPMGVGLNPLLPLTLLYDFYLQTLSETVGTLVVHHSWQKNTKGHIQPPLWCSSLWCLANIIG